MSAGRARPDVGPASWEIPLAAVLVWLTVAALLLPAARGAAALLAGGGWVWPHGSAALVASVGGLLTAQPTAGLDTAQTAALPPPAAVYTAIAGCLALFLAASGAAAWTGHRWLTGRSGMATHRQVADVLGSGRLRRVGQIGRAHV